MFELKNTFVVLTSFATVRLYVRMLKYCLRLHVHFVSLCGSHADLTGNDLARALKWGSGYTGEKPVSILRSLENTDKVDFDRCVYVCVCVCVCACVCVRACVHVCVCCL